LADRRQAPRREPATRRTWHGAEHHRHWHQGLFNERPSLPPSRRTPARRERASFGSHSTYSPGSGSNLSNRRRDSCLAHDSHRRKNPRRSNQRHLQLDRGGVMHTRLRRQPWHRYTGSPS